MALLSSTAAVAVLDGPPPFVDYGPLPLRCIVALEPYLLVSRDEFPARHAYLVAQTLDGHGAEFAAAVSVNPTESMPMHPGVLAYINGLAIPELDSPKP